MCFSAPASFVASASLATIGVASVKKTRTKAELPLALVPVLFGFQQGVEGIIWLTLGGNMSALTIASAYVYLMFSHVLWPIWMPLAIMMIEPDRQRRQWLAAVGVVGIATSSYLAYLIFSVPINLAIVNQSLAYGITYSGSGQYLLMLGYFLATCASGLFSSHRLINIFGLMVALTGIAAYNFYSTSFISVWCFFAAIASILILIYLNSKRK